MVQIICILAEDCYTGNRKSFAFLIKIISSMFEALIAAILIAFSSLVGVLFFTHDRHLVGLEKYVVPVAVGVFLSLVLYGLIPETLSLSPEWGAIVIAAGFIAFYILANILHEHYHEKGADDCDRKGAAMLLLIGDAIHNMADGVILAGAFLIDPAIGMATAVGLLLHELPQEVVEFGVLLRAGYTRTQAALRNLLSASSIVLGVVVTYIVAQFSMEYLWLLTGFAAGNLLFLAASDLLPRIHGNLKNYGTIWRSAMSIILGFTMMTLVLWYTHEHYGHGHDEHEEHEEMHEIEIVEA